MPALRSSRPASPAQLRFIETLVSERLPEDYAALVHEIADARSNRPIRRDLIDRLMATPRSVRPASRPSGEFVRRHDGDPIETPSANVRAGRMLRAGGIEATVTLHSGQHVTIRVKTSKRSGRGWARCAPTDEGARTSVEILGQRVGWINVTADGSWMLTLRTRRDDYRTGVLAIFEHAATGTTAGGERVQVADRCGRCHLPLTDPVSIDRGIGPDCFGRDTGSQHVARERAAAGDVEVRITGGTRQAAEMLSAAAREVDEIRAEAAMEAAAFEPAPVRRSLTELASAVGAQRSTDRDVARARDLIAEALDANCNAADMAFAMRIFDQLAAR
jgi:hypothetical protein